jgi:hypothetical protein
LHFISTFQSCVLALFLLAAVYAPFKLKPVSHTNMYFIPIHSYANLCRVSHASDQASG